MSRQTPRPCNPVITQRYAAFLTDLLASANTETPIKLSQLATKHKVPTYTYSCAAEIGFFKEMTNTSNGVTIVWIPTDHPSTHDAITLHKAVKVVQTQIKRNNVAKAKSAKSTKPAAIAQAVTSPNNTKGVPNMQKSSPVLKKPVQPVTKPTHAKVSFSGMSVTVPIVDGLIEVEVEGKKLQINI